ncbi:unnamed protein product [Phytophthora lilii]|uniref:Unnamed protein product n=1 Tax=Phytophthora lilii TaxID=2077276 RepID=A0A9W6Y2S7_9STRA|nr:unnamed protein product [Phytophthora lilii]
MDECKAVVSPVDMSSRLVPSDAATKVNAPFREAVGALMHLMTATRPDIAYAVGYCCQESASSSLGIPVNRLPTTFTRGAYDYGTLIMGR